MLLTNHTLTGVALGLSTGHPALALPLGLVSHLVLDAMPHFGPSRPWGWRDPRFLVVGSIDFASSLALTAAAAWLWPAQALPVLAGVLGAALPDLTYIPLILFTKERVVTWLPWYRPMLAFLSQIQWYERPPGIIAEVAWAVIMSIFLGARLS